MKKILSLIKKYRNLILLIIGVLAIISLMIGIIIFMNSRGKKDPNVTTSFFIKNEDNLYALFNEKGKQLTDFIYDTIDDIYNGVARVKTKDGKYGVINENGKYVVNLGKYDSVTQYGGLFKVLEDKETYSLLNSKGKRVASDIDTNINAYTNIKSFIVYLKNNKYVIMNYNGNKIYTFNSSDKESSSLPQANEYENFGVVSYDGLNVIFNIKTGKVISKIKDDSNYCINAVSENEKKILAYTCTAWYETSQDVTYKIITNKKVESLPNKCNRVTLNDDALVCKTDSGSFLLDDKLEITDIDITNITYKDNKNYAIVKDNNVNIVKNNKVVSTIEKATLSDKGYSKNGIYLVYNNNEFSFYNEKGKKLFEKSFISAISFDSNLLARVSDDGKNYYNINTKGKKVSDYFNVSSLSEDYYIITKDNKKGVMNKKGKILVKTNYDDVSIKINNEKTYALVKKGKKYTLINLENKKEILSVTSEPIFYDHYLMISKDEKNLYYTYNGIKFYEEK